MADDGERAQQWAEDLERVRAEPIDVVTFVAPSMIAAEIDAAIGERAATDYLTLLRQFQKHLDMLDAYLMAPSPMDELQPRLTAASGLLSAMDAYVDAVARAGAQALGDARAVMLRFCVKHELRRSVLMRLAARAGDAAQEPRHLFITGEYER
jgi:hypothetical protein